MQPDNSLHEIGDNAQHFVSSKLNSNACITLTEKDTTVGSNMDVYMQVCALER